MQRKSPRKEDDSMHRDLNLTVMLTWHDQTVLDAPALFEACRTSKAQTWGFKERPLPPDQMRALFARMRACGKTTVLEVVAYTEAECLAGAQAAADCGCDILMGTRFYDSVSAFCRAHHLKYMPYVGQVSGRPSVLRGTAAEMIREAKHCLARGAWGIDLLAYRYEGDAEELIRQFMAEVDAPVCIAGSINSTARLKALQAARPWAFTIGGALFEEKFGQGFAAQIDWVCDTLHPGGQP